MRRAFSHRAPAAGTRGRREVPSPGGCRASRYRCGPSGRGGAFYTRGVRRGFFSLQGWWQVLSPAGRGGASGNSRFPGLRYSGRSRPGCFLSSLSRRLSARQKHRCVPVASGAELPAFRPPSPGAPGPPRTPERIFSPRSLQRANNGGKRQIAGKNRNDPLHPLPLPLAWSSGSVQGSDTGEPPWEGRAEAAPAVLQRPEEDAAPRGEPLGLGGGLSAKSPLLTPGAGDPGAGLHPSGPATKSLF